MNKNISALTMERIRLQAQLRLLAARPDETPETEPDNDENPDNSRPEKKPAKQRVIRGGKWQAAATPQPIFQPQNI